MFDDLIYSLNIKFLNMQNLINKELYNIIPGSENKSVDIRSKFNNNLLDKLKWQEWTYYRKVLLAKDFIMY